MSEPLNFNFPLPLLLQEADTIVTAAETNPAINPRLPANYVTDTRPLIQQTSDLDAAQKGQAANAGTLTLQQEADLKTLNAAITSLRTTAKKVFKGNPVKLRDEFQVGINSPRDLASILQRARIMLAAAQNPANALVLATKGWIAADTTAFDAAITALDTDDDQQGNALIDAAGGTGTRNHTANDLYERVEAIQNAANLQWPASVPANSVIRAKFRLGLFPPPHTPGSSDTPPTPPAPPAPPHP
jgi:hypothetical protein